MGTGTACAQRAPHRYTTANVTHGCEIFDIIDGAPRSHLSSSPKGDPPALPGRQPLFNISGSRFFSDVVSCTEVDDAGPLRVRAAKPRRPLQVAPLFSLVAVRPL